MSDKRESQSETPPCFPDADGASVRARWTASIMCGHVNAAAFTIVVYVQKLNRAAWTHFNSLKLT